MAVSATFAADFTSFYAAIDKADVKLRGLDSSSQFVERGLNRLVDQFSGRKLIQEATLMADAVEKIGGKSKLTEQELQSVGNKAAEAADKMRRLGVEVPPKLEDLAKSAQKPVSVFTEMLGVIGKIGPALGVGFGIGSITSFAKSVGEMSGKFVDLNAQTQISIKRLQALDYAGAGVGLNIDNITQSADQLAKRLGGGDTSVTGALEKLKLKGDDLKQLGLDEVMFEIDEALVGVGNQFERARILGDLFGRSGSQLGRLMTGDLRKVIEEAEKTGAVIDEELIKKADEFDDAWTQAWMKFKAVSVTVIGETARALGFLQPKSGGPSSGDRVRDANQFRVGEGPVSQDTPAMREIRLQKEIEAQIGAMTGGLRSPLSRGLGLPAIGISDKELAQIEKAGKARLAELAAQEKWNAAREREREAIEQASQGMSYWIAKIEQFPTVVQNNMFNPSSAAEFGLGFLADLPSRNLDVRGLMGGPANISRGRGSGRTPSFSLGGGGFALGDFLKGNLGNTIMGSLMGGGNTGGSVGGLLGGGIAQKILGTGIGKSIGGMLGGTLGSVIPGIGNILGSLAGSGLGKLLGGLFRNEGKETNRARDSAIDDFTGITGDKGASQSKFREMASAAGIASAEIDKLFSTGKIKNFESEFARMSKTIRDFTTDQEADQERLNAAIEKYGFTIDQIGPALQKQRLDDQAKELIEDWRVLIGSGVEITDVNNGMSEAINEYLQTAIRLGQEVPNAMRPILEKMLEQGTLTDEAGNAITDLQDAGIKFSETMTEGFDRVVEKLGELIEKIGLANQELGKMPDPPSGPSNNFLPTDENLDIIPMASGGRGRVTRPTLFLAGEAGPEDVAFSGANRRFSGGGDAGTAQAIEQLAARMDSLIQVLPNALRDAVVIGRARFA